MKRNSKPIADMGGPRVMVGFLSGIFTFIGVEVFALQSLPDLIYILASLCTILIISLIGIFDVLTSLIKTEGRWGNI